jgi:hypothetical protein
MAIRIPMKDPKTGVIVDGFYGYSWTTLFFGALPALFRGDFKTFAWTAALMIFLAVTTFGVGTVVFSIVWSFLYNKYYTRNLLKEGHVFFGTEEQNREFARAIGFDLAGHPQGAQTPL